MVFHYFYWKKSPSFMSVFLNFEGDNPLFNKMAVKNCSKVKAHGDPNKQKHMVKEVRSKHCINSKNKIWKKNQRPNKV